MKKILLFLLVCSFAVLAFTACGEPADETSGNTIGNVSGDVLEDVIGNASGNATDNTTGSTPGETSGDKKGEYTLSTPVTYDSEKDLVIGFRDMDSFARFKEMTKKTDSEIKVYFEEEHFEEYTGKEDMHYVIGILGNIKVPDFGPEYKVVAITLWNKSGEVYVIYEKEGKQITAISYIDQSKSISADSEAFTDITVDNKPVTLYWNFSSNDSYVFGGVVRGDGFLLELHFPRMTADAIKADFPENIEVITWDQYILKYWQ